MPGTDLAGLKGSDRNRLDSALRSGGYGCSNRLSVTVPYSLYSLLEERSCREGRSMSNLAAYLLECALSGHTDQTM
jgi:hypothetical protein